MPSYFPENNTAQWGDTAERSLQKISDLLKNGDVPIKINSVAVTGPFTVNNEVEITNDEGNPLPVAGVLPDGSATAVSLTSGSRLRVEDAPLELIGTYTVPSGTNNSDPIRVSNFPFGTVLLFQSEDWPAGANQTWRLRAGILTGGVSWVPTATPVLYSATSQLSVANTLDSDSFLYRTAKFGGTHVRFERDTGSGGPTTFRVYKYAQLDFGAGFPHVNSISSLVYALDNNLMVSDFQTQTRLGDVDDIAPTGDTPSDKGLIPLFKRLLVRMTNLIDRFPGTLGTKTAASSFPVVIASDQATLGVSGTVGVSNLFATEGTLTTLNNKVPSNLTVTSNRLDVNTGLSIPTVGQQTMSGSLPVVLANDHSTIVIRASSSDFVTASGELTSDISTPVLLSPFDGRRRYLFLQNLSTAPIYVNFTADATVNSLRLDAGASLAFEGNFVPTNQVNLLRSSTSGQRYFLMHAQ
jgi:hypothetical protein